jgi:hypothetical protein
VNDRVQRPFRILRSTLDAARAAVAALKGVEGVPQSLDQLADEAFREKVDRLADEHNAGQPFPPAPGKLPNTPADIARIAALGQAARRRKREESGDDQ